MPKIVEKHEFGSGYIIRFGNGPNAGKFYLRVKRKCIRAYRQRIIKGATTMADAITLAVGLIEELSAKDAIQTAKTGIAPDHAYLQNYIDTRLDLKPTETIVNSVKIWLGMEEKRSYAGQVKIQGIDKKRRQFDLHVIPYLKSKNITRTNHLNLGVFDGYLLYRKHVTALTLKNELTIITQWLKFLAGEKMIAPELLMNQYRPLVPTQQIKQSDLTANPGINEKDWKIFVDRAKSNTEVGINSKAHFFRVIFYYFIQWQKSSGMSPEETIKMKFNQLEVIQQGGKSIVYVTTTRAKTKKTREIAVDFAFQLQEWVELIKGYKKGHGLDPLVSTDYVFGDPRRNMKPYAYNSYNEQWVSLRGQVEHNLQGSRYSNKKYTLYSLRTSFIEDRLKAGVSIFDVATQAGNTAAIIQQIYARLNIRNQGIRQINAINQHSNNLSSSVEQVNLF